MNFFKPNRLLVKTGKMIAVLYLLFLFCTVMIAISDFKLLKETDQKIEEVNRQLYEMKQEDAEMDKILEKARQYSEGK